MSRLEIIKFTKQYHDQSNVVCEELKADMKITSQPVVINGKVLKKEGSGKGDSYTCPMCMVQLILGQIVNDTSLVAISPNIASWTALAMSEAQFIVQ